MCAEPEAPSIGEGAGWRVRKHRGRTWAQLFLCFSLRSGTPEPGNSKSKPGFPDGYEGVFTKEREESIFNLRAIHLISNF